MVTIPHIPESDNTKIVQRPRIGQLCVFNKRAIKSRYRQQDRRYTRWISHADTMMIEAYYIGWRVVRDGVTRYVYEDGYSYPDFLHGQSHIVWLFVENERKNPIYAFPEDVEWSAS